MITPITGQEEDWAKARQCEELAVDKMLRPAPHRVHYFTEDTSADFLREIDAENTRAALERINYHE